ncbi:type II toxin-antitoxin system RelE/ParE family toxin [soil metagenome]
MSKHILSSQADDDLSEIFLFIAADNPDAGEKLMHRFRELFRLIAKNPRLGRERYELQQKMRSVPEGSYLIFYRIWADDVMIVRVLHAARDLGEIFS